MVKRELKKIGYLIYEAEPKGITMYVLGDDNNSYSRVYLNFLERKELMLDLLKSEMDEVKIELHRISEEMNRHAVDDPFREKLQRKAKDLMIYYENLDMTYKNLKKMVEGDE
jgi:hypothetical protein